MQTVVTRRVIATSNDSSAVRELAGSKSMAAARCRSANRVIMSRVHSSGAKFVFLRRHAFGLRPTTSRNTRQ